LREIICHTCGKIWVCLADYWESNNGQAKQFILCTRCDNICADCYAKKISARPELVREMNPNCYPRHYRIVNPSRRKG
jgi:hypothetical protein